MQAHARSNLEWIYDKSAQPYRRGLLISFAASATFLLAEATPAEAHSRYRDHDHGYRAYHYGHSYGRHHHHRRHGRHHGDAMVTGAITGIVMAITIIIGAITRPSSRAPLTANTEFLGAGPGLNRGPVAPGHDFAICPCLFPAAIACRLCDARYAATERERRE